MLQSERYKDGQYCRPILDRISLSISPMQAKYVLTRVSRISQKSGTIYSQSVRAFEAIFTVRSGDISRVSCTPQGFTYSPSIMEFSHAIWCRWSAKGCASPWEPKRLSSVGAQSFTLDSLSLSLFYSFLLESTAEKDSGLFCVWAIGALYTRFTVCCRVTRFRGFSSNVCRKWRRYEAHSFRWTVTRECKDRKHTGLVILMTRCNVLRLSSVPSLRIMHDTTFQDVEKVFLFTRVSMFEASALNIQHDAYRYNMHRVIAYERFR